MSRKSFGFEWSSNAVDLARVNHWRAQRMRSTMKASTEANANLMLDAAREASSLSDHSLQDLARIGHPYARRRPFPPHPPWLIHTQRGNFLKRWYARTFQRGDDFGFELGNTARTRNGRTLLPLLEGGTKKMIPRPILSQWLNPAHRKSQFVRKMELNNRRAYQAAVALHGAAATSRAGAYLRKLG